MAENYSAMSYVQLEEDRMVWSFYLEYFYLILSYKMKYNLIPFSFGSMRYRIVASLNTTDLRVDTLLAAKRRGKAFMTRAPRTI